ncbi:MAG: putative molybdenum carrier protein [Thermodesulfobacteriota bacterium]|nr:putative molybdenum carrier protein [Thermodesulfobacteriota bacterium]
MKKYPLKIISGGQTGADRAALDAAMDLGIDYGGSLPKGRKAEDGQLDPKYEKLIELESADYTIRTEKNVVDSDGTLIFTRGTPAGGTGLTVKYALKHRKPFLIVNFNKDSPDQAADKIRAWLDSAEPRILNVAGPRESLSPGMYSNVLYVMKKCRLSGISRGRFLSGDIPTAV